jgi:hypothetical protein
MSNIKKNENLARVWVDDESDEYTRCVILSMINSCANPNNSSHVGPLTPEVCRKWAQDECDAQDEGPRCAYAADVLFALADKLHEAD